MNQLLTTFTAAPHPYLAEMHAFSSKERDVETGLSYFGARYYSSDLSIWLSVDPMADKYPSLSPYTYCADNPVKLVDPNGEEIGDYYNLKGQWLGSDNNPDNFAYTASSVTKNENGTVVAANNKKKLPITNSELLDRATWVCGESGGSMEQITSRIQNAGDATSMSDAAVAEYYAFAINNASIADKGFYNAVYNRMGKMIDGVYTKTYNGYFKGEGLGGNENSKAFAEARKTGALNSESRFTNSIAAVIKSVTSSSDPTGGCRAWLGSTSAANYVSNPNAKYSSGKKSAITQFSFSSKKGTFNHSFYRF